MSSATELANWLNGVADGGPNGDGRYPLTYADGLTYLVYCPAAQALNPSLTELPVELFAGQADAAADAAQTAAIEADADRIAAASAAANAIDAAATATTAKTTAVSAAAAADASADAAEAAKIEVLEALASFESGAGAPGFLAQATPPSTTQVGSRWLNTTNGREFTLYYDGTNQWWVELGPDSTVITSLPPDIIDGGAYA